MDNPDIIITYFNRQALNRYKMWSWVLKISKSLLADVNSSRKCLTQQWCRWQPWQTLYRLKLDNEGEGLYWYPCKKPATWKRPPFAVTSCSSKGWRNYRPRNKSLLPQRKEYLSGLLYKGDNGILTNKKGGIHKTQRARPRLKKWIIRVENAYVCFSSLVSQGCYYFS
jgi:hypothetical protein